MNKRYVLVLIVAAAVVAVWALRFSGGRSPLAVDELARASAFVPTAGTPSGAIPAQRAAPVPATTAADAESADVFIEGVDVDKTKVCRGEDVTVTVRVRTQAGAEPYLRCGVARRSDLVGCKFTIRPAQSIAADDMEVFAFAKNVVIATAFVPPVAVDDCAEPHQLTFKVEKRFDAHDRGRFEAAIASTVSEPFAPVSFHWDFGDGHVETTSGPTVEHSYEHRLQTRATSYFMVKVTARSASGSELAATRSIELSNLGFLHFVQKGRVVVFSGVADDPAGGERIWLYHGAPSSVFLDKVVVKTWKAGAKPQLLAEYDARSFLGFTELRPGESRELWSLERHQPSDPNTTHLVEVRGRSDGARVADGAFTLLYRGGPTAALDNRPMDQEQGESE
jgi:hypothetical protein